jgi:hypothetical protein
MEALWLVVAGFLAALYAGGRVFAWTKLFRPTRKIEATPADVGVAYEDVVFVGEDGCRLHGWWMPEPHARGTVLYCHGNSGNIGSRVGLARDLRTFGVNVFLFDYRGYGRSRGVPTEKGTYRDARAAYEVVRARHGDEERPPVIVFGCSLGGAVAVQLAADKHPRGLVLESTFTSLLEIGRRLYPRLPMRWMCGRRYDSLRKVGALTMPKLFAHSTRDELVPFDLGEKLFREAHGPKNLVVLEGPHDEAGWNHSPDYVRRLEAFVGQVLGPRTS